MLCVKTSTRWHLSIVYVDLIICVQLEVWNTNSQYLKLDSILPLEYLDHVVEISVSFIIFR